MISEETHESVLLHLRLLLYEPTPGREGGCGNLYVGATELGSQRGERARPVFLKEGRFSLCL